MFGGNPFNQMRRHMAEMDRMMSEPFNMMDRMMGQVMGGFGGPPMLGFGDPVQSRSQNSNNVGAMDLFGGGGFGFGGGLMRAMDSAMSDPNSMVFSSSTMITMNPDGTQRVIQNSTRKAGEVKETRSAVRDGEQERVAVSHHIGDRTHLIEKKRDKDGRVRQNQRFVNLDEADAEEFNSEFRQRASRNLGGMDPFRPSANRRRVIEGGRNNGRSRHPAIQSAASGSAGGSSSSNAPIVTIPDDDDSDEPQPHGSRYRRSNRRKDNDNDADNYGNDCTSSGPIIREISDDETDAERSKRRKGMFGKFFGDKDN